MVSLRIRRATRRAALAALDRVPASLPGVHLLWSGIPILDLRIHRLERTVQVHRRRYRELAELADIVENVLVPSVLGDPMLGDPMLGDSVLGDPVLGDPGPGDSVPENSPSLDRLVDKYAASI